MRPGFGGDPQSVINSQISDDYDVFLGIFWSRLGTPTSRSPSGSVEEFERAHSRFRLTGSAPEIMFYFKDAPISPSKVDASQLGALQAFKASLTSRGGLYSIFEDQAGFEASLRVHLSAIAQKFAIASAQSNDLQRLPAQIPDALIGADEVNFGLLDFMDIYTSRTVDMTSAMTSISEATIRVGEQLSQKTAELQGSGGTPQATRRFIERTSHDMFQFADTLEIQVTQLSKSRKDAFSALSNAVALMADFPGNLEQLGGLRNTLNNTKENASTARAGVTAMRDATSSLPPISKDLNKAKRAVTDKLEKFMTEIDSTESTLANLIEAISRLLDSPRPEPNPRISDI